MAVTELTNTTQRHTTKKLNVNGSRVFYFMLPLNWPVSVNRPKFPENTKPYTTKIKPGSANYLNLIMSQPKCLPVCHVFLKFIFLHSFYLMCPFVYVCPCVHPYKRALLYNSYLINVLFRERSTCRHLKTHRIYNYSSVLFLIQQCIFYFYACFAFLDSFI